MLAWVVVLIAQAQLYGIADFSRRDAYPTDNAVAIWDNLDPGVSGDILLGAGDVETGAAGGGCAYCPTGFSCVCAGASTLTQDTSVLYKGNASIKVDVDGATSIASILLAPVAMDANAFYQISWWMRSLTGADDAKYALLDGASYYNPTTNTWGAAVEPGIINIPTTWTRYVVFVNVGVTGRNARFYINRLVASQTYWIDNIEIVKINNTSSVSSPGGYAVAPAVTADPVYGRPKSMPVVAGQVVREGLYADGVNDYLVMASDVAAFDAAQTGNLSVCAEYHIPGAPVPNTTIASKASNASRGWFSYSTGANFSYYISKDGGAVNVSTAQSTHAANAVNAGCATYRRVSDGSSQLRVQANYNAAGNNVTAVAPIFNTVAPLSVFNRSDGSGVNWIGEVTRLGVFNTALSIAEISRWISPYFPHADDTDGFYTTTCVQAASHAVCSANKCIDGTANRCMPDSQWMPTFGQYTELANYNSAETVVGTDDAPVFTGWVPYLDGGMTFTAYRDDTKHGDVAMRFRGPGIGAYGDVTGGCETVGIGNPIQVYVAAKRRALDPVYSAIYVETFDNGVCAGMITGRWQVREGDLSNVWEWYGGTWNAWPVGTASYRMVVQVVQDYDVETDVLLDTFSIVESPIKTPWVHNAGAGDTVVSLRELWVNNPLAQVKQNGRYAYQDGFCVGVWVWTDWVGNDGVGRIYFLNVSGTAGNNNRWFFQKTATSNLQFAVYDSAGNPMTRTVPLTGFNWPASSAKYIEACTSNTGVTAARHYETSNSTWYVWGPSGAGTGIQTGQTTTSLVGNAAVESVNAYIGPIYLGSYSATWPMYGFDRRPRQRPY